MNCFEVWCTPTPPSQVNFTAFLDECPTAAPQQQPQLGRGGGLSTFSLTRNGEDHAQEHNNYNHNNYNHNNYNHNNNIYRTGGSGGSSGVSASEVGPMDHGPMGQGAHALGEGVEAPLHLRRIHVHGDRHSCSSGAPSAQHWETPLCRVQEEEAGSHHGGSAKSHVLLSRQDDPAAAVLILPPATVHHVQIDVNVLRHPPLCEREDTTQPQLPVRLFGAGLDRV